MEAGVPAHPAPVLRSVTLERGPNRSSRASRGPAGERGRQPPNRFADVAEARIGVDQPIPSR
jgi:hypothetical protein